MFKTIDFCEIETNPDIVDDTFQQLIGQNVEFSANVSNEPLGVPFIGKLEDYIVTDKTITLIIDNTPLAIVYFMEGYLEIKFDDFFNIITVCYKKV